MKTSKYNFFFPYEADENKLIAYNSFSNALALMEKAQYDKFQQFADDGIHIDDEEFVEQLKKGCFLIDDDCNELDRIRLRMLRSRFKTDALSITIATTADCQFRCPYCYEKDVLKPDYMTEEIEEEIVKLVQNKVKTILTLSITWYGGDPMMNMGTVERLSRKFIALCEDNEIQYNANMVTNGYLLTNENVKLLNELKVTTLQVTLDGDEEIHNSRRPHVDGSGTYATIVNNLVENKDILPYISLRINIDKNNADAWREIVKLVKEKGLSDKVMPYLGRITPDNSTYDKASCFDCGSFSKETFHYFKEFHEANDAYMIHYPITKENYCGADQINAHTIGADGRLYQCWIDIGDNERCTGRLVGGADSKENVYMEYMLHDPTVNSKCSKCNMLPVCMGGCPFRRLERDDDKCSTYKYVLDGFLDVIARKLKLKKDLEVSAPNGV